MAELYSKPLSSGARETLVDFLVAYLEILKVAEVDEIMPQAAFLIQRVMDEQVLPRDAARKIVEIAKQARSIDRSWRPGGKP